MSTPADLVMQTYNFHRGKLPECYGLLIKERKIRANSLLDRISLEKFEQAIKKAAKSSKLLGYYEARDYGSFSKADFDWFLNPENVIKVLEGKYDDATGPEAPAPGEVQKDLKITHWRDDQGRLFAKIGE